MTATTNPEFHADSESLEVVNAFPASIRDKIIVITGVNPDGIGFTTALAFASQAPRLLIIAGRSPQKLQQSIDNLKAQFAELNCRTLRLDLSSQKAVRRAAAEVLTWKDVPTIDLLINNAGVMLLPKRTINDDGIEMHFATNHIGHFLFSNLILPKLVKAAAGQAKGATRIINVSSSSPMSAGIRWSDINFERVNRTLPEAQQPPYAMLKAWGTEDPENKSYVSREAYNQSKVANVLFAVGLNKRFYEKHGILSLAVNPGVIPTELNRHTSSETFAQIQEWGRTGIVHIKTLGAGAATTVVAATDPRLASPIFREGKENYGVYLVDCQISDQANHRAISSENAERLWKISEDLVGQAFV